MLRVGCDYGSAGEMARVEEASNSSGRGNMSRALQALKIHEIGEALKAAGLRTIQGKATALGLSRSTTWAVLQADYKNSGLSAALVNTMLASPKIPEPVRGKLFEYVDEKISGRYGHNAIQLRRFVSRLALAHHTAESHRVQAAITNRLRTVHSADHVRVAIGPPRPAQPDSDPASQIKLRRVS